MRTNIHTYIRVYVCVCLARQTSCSQTVVQSVIVYLQFLHQIFQKCDFKVVAWYAIGGLSAFGFFFISQLPSEAFLYLTVLK